MSQRPHGYARYRLDGCRCYTCGYARSQYDDRRNRLIAYGQWEPFVGIEETQFRIQSLKDLGFGDRAIATLAGIERKTIRDIAAGIRHDPSRNNPPLTKIRRETAAAVAAIPYDQLEAPDGAYIDATLTWERIGQLLDAGYTRTWIARRLGSTAKTPALQLGRRRVTARQARAVRDLVTEVMGPRVKAAATTPGPRGLVVSAAEILAAVNDVGEVFDGEAS
jgi:hypothetical protein